MQLFTLALLLVLEVAYGTTLKRVKRIADGHVISITDSPFITALVVKKHKFVMKDHFQCAATIVANRCVITSAHCVTLLKQLNVNKYITIRSNNDHWTKGIEHTILKWAVHPKYNDTIRINDIAILKVKQKFSGRSAKKISLVPPEYPYKQDEEARVTGWGFQFDDYPSVMYNLRENSVVLFNQSYCQDIYEAYDYDIYDSMICAAGSEGNSGACTFDTGGPLFQHQKLLGIVSWGIKCGNRFKPAVFTRIGEFYNWIRNKMKRLRCG